MSAVIDVLRGFVGEVKSLDFAVEDAPDKFTQALADTIQRICEISRPSAGRSYSFRGLWAAAYDLATDLPEVYPRVCSEGIVFAAEVLIDALSADTSILIADCDPNVFSYQLPEPEADGARLDSERIVTRLQCVEVLAGAFFGVVSRVEWGKRKQCDGGRDMTEFTCEKLWEYNGNKWGTKNFVLMGIVLYFFQVSRAGRDALSTETLTITRKALGKTFVSDAALFCPIDLQQDRVSIHGFTGDAHLQADFANEYLGGGVLGGGGSQEESMFVECTELLVTMYLVEKMLPFEAVEIAGAKKYVEHNMMGSRSCKKSEQFCRPAAVAQTAVTAVALDAICFNKHGSVQKHDQYQAVHILRELRKCLVALSTPCRTPVADARMRSFVTGLWGCGAFRGDAELKCIIQWICCSLEPTIDRMIFCPFDQHRQLVDGGLAQLMEKLTNKLPVKTVLDLLIEDRDYLRSSSTFGYLLGKLAAMT